MIRCWARYNADGLLVELLRMVGAPDPIGDWIEATQEEAAQMQVGTTVRES